MTDYEVVEEGIVEIIFNYMGFSASIWAFDSNQNGIVTDKIRKGRMFFINDREINKFNSNLRNEAAKIIYPD